MSYTGSLHWKKAGGNNISLYSTHTLEERCGNNISFGGKLEEYMNNIPYTGTIHWSQTGGMTSHYTGDTHWRKAGGITSHYTSATHWRKAGGITSIIQAPYIGGKLEE
jgi:hypothetical protein